MAPNRRLLYNSDGTHLFLGANPCPGALRTKVNEYRDQPVTLEQLLAQVDEVAGRQVDTFLLCPIDLESVFYRSRLERRTGDGATEEQIRQASPALHNRIRAFQFFDRLGIDPFARIVERIRDRGMEALGTIRLQAAHSQMGNPFNREVTRSRWLETNPQFRLPLEDARFGGGQPESFMDFAHPEVRQRKLDLIREFVNRYELDGVEIDFQRFPVYFRAAEARESAPIMTGFLRQLRRALDEDGARRGRRLVLGGRVPETLRRCRDLGLDPVAWVRSAGLDYLSLARFLHQNAFDARAVGYPLPQLTLDFASFRSELPESFPIYGTLNSHYAFPEPDENGRLRLKGAELTPNDFRHEAVKLWQAGANGIELFNFFTLRAHSEDGNLPLFLLDEIGDPNRIGKMRHEEENDYIRRHPVAELTEDKRRQREMVIDYR